MLDLMEDVLKKQICSVCEKYLSVLPIKVYPNRQVKCGRCCGEDDGGVVSVLYQTIIKHLKFPCIFHMEGCRELLCASEMKNHEEQCSKKKYNCLVCAKEFIANSFELCLHINKEHQELVLKYPVFPIRIEFPSRNLVLENKVYYYTADKTILFINLLITDEGICFEPYIVGTDATIQFSIYSPENKLLCKTKIFPCTKWGKAVSETIRIDFAALKFSEGEILSCIFQLLNECYGMLPVTKPLSKLILDSSVPSAVLRFKFENILNLKSNVYSHATYYVENLPWKMYIYKRTYDDSVSHLSCFLELGAVNKSLSYCATIGSITLLSKYPTKNIESEGFTRIYNAYSSSWGNLEHVEWCTLINEENGYIDNDSITFEVDLVSVLRIKEKCDCETCSSVCEDVSKIRQLKSLKKL